MKIKNNTVLHKEYKYRYKPMAKKDKADIYRKRSAMKEVSDLPVIISSLLSRILIRVFVFIITYVSFYYVITL